MFDLCVVEASTWKSTRVDFDPFKPREALLAHGVEEALCLLSLRALCGLALRFSAGASTLHKTKRKRPREGRSQEAGEVPYLLEHEDSRSRQSGEMRSN